MMIKVYHIDVHPFSYVIPKKFISRNINDVVKIKIEIRIQDDSYLPV